MLLGIPGRSLALSVAQRWGVPQEVIERARSYLSPVSKRRSSELEEIESFKQQILELKNQTTKDRDEARKSKETYLELVKKFREQKDRWLEKASEKAQKKIENLIEEARQDRLKNRTLHDLKSELPEIIKAKGNSGKPQSLDEFKNLFKPGTPAFSTRLGRQVLIQGEPDSKGQVLVLADSMRVQLPWHGLVSMNVNPSEEKSVTIRRSGAASAIPTDDDAPELDLRGKRIDDALPILEKWLDDCMRNQKDNIKIIHGYGTEQLKKSVRQFFSKSRYVQTWKAGDASSGGDGVTWVSLSD